jgi:predicted unusual protein kinase regulating ubiquinone biosynthesis (AarF/ABC1/UbiB family)
VGLVGATDTLLRVIRLLSLPVGTALLGAEGLARRAVGQDAEQVRRDVHARTVARTRRVLGETRGGALKAGQFLSAVEALLPADPDRTWQQALTSLQENSRGMPWPDARGVLEADLGQHWPDLFCEFDFRPAAAASIGQVHRARWRDGTPRGREVAVKVQYPGVREAILTDLRLLAVFGRAAALVARGLAMPAILAELRGRLMEELDYTREAMHQKAFHGAYSAPGEPAAEAVVPDVVHATSRVLVQDWLDGEPLAQVAMSGSRADRDRVGLLYQRFLLSGPQRTGLLHTDPHPGNFRLLPDGRLGVLDFGSCLTLPDGLPVSFGRLIRSLQTGGDGDVLAALRANRLLRPGTEIDVAKLRDYLAPFSEPARHEVFSYSTTWLRQEFSRVNDPRSPEFSVGLKLSIPPEQLFTFRVWLGIVGVLCQLEATVAVGPELRRWLPGFDGG